MRGLTQLDPCVHLLNLHIVNTLEVVLYVKLSHSENQRQIKSKETSREHISHLQHENDLTSWERDTGPGWSAAADQDVPTSRTTRTKISCAVVFGFLLSYEP